MSPTRSFVYVGMLALCVVCSTQASADVALNGGGTTRLFSLARDAVDGSSYNLVWDYPAALPYAQTVQAQEQGANAAGVFNLSNVEFSFRMLHHHPLAQNSTAASGVEIYFSVNAPTDYIASGQYTSTRSGSATYETTSFQAKLTDLTTNTVLFYSYQQSDLADNPTFVLGGTAGDTSNTMEGSLTGSLVVGNQYFFEGRGDLYAYGNAGDASGWMSLALVPEPTTMVLLAAGALLASRRFRNRTSTRSALSLHSKTA